MCLVLDCLVQAYRTGLTSVMPRPLSLKPWNLGTLLLACSWHMVTLTPLHRVLAILRINGVHVVHPATAISSAKRLFIMPHQAASAPVIAHTGRCVLNFQHSASNLPVEPPSCTR